MPKTEKWIQPATAHMHKGALHKQLGIPAAKTIPTKTLNDIVKTPVGQKSHGATVTPLLKKRALFAKNIRK